MSSALHQATNYHAWMFEWLAPHVRGRVLDIGGGTGNHLQHIVAPELTCIDVDAAVVAELPGRFGARPNWHFKQGDITDPAIVETLGRFDTVLSCNVFEHIRDDSLAFRHAARLLAPRGRLVLLLPALPQLYGSMDRLAGHFRRYDRATVRERLAGTELEIKELRYVNALGALGWWVNARWPRHRDLSSPAINAQIEWFDRLAIPWLRSLERGRNLPFGQSLVVVAEKADASRD